MFLQYGWIITSTKESDEERLAFFESHLHHVLEDNDELYSLRSFDVVLFPIFEERHYYLVCIDLKNPSINMHESQTIVGFRDDPDYMKKDTPYKVLGYNEEFCGLWHFCDEAYGDVYGQSYEGLGLWISERRKN
ncbi:hypothetical protein R6Q57_015319 [Mikania cordata]